MQRGVLRSSHPPLDLCNPVLCAQEIADAIPSALLVEISSVQGHQAAASASPDDVAFLNEEISAFPSDVRSAE